MPNPSSPAPSVPPCLGADSAHAWAWLRNYYARHEGRMLFVIRHNSPRLPRELPPLLAEESGRQIVIAAVSDAEPDPMAAALRAAPGGNLPPRCILSITSAEDLAITAADDSRAALHEFARLLDLRGGQFHRGSGIVLVWATEPVFDALAEHALDFISRTTAIFTLAATGEKGGAGAESGPSIDHESIRRRHGLPPLPPEAPGELHKALAAFEELAVANELYLQGGPKIAHALAAYDAARYRIEAGWAAAGRLAALDAEEIGGESDDGLIRNFARALFAAWPSAGIYFLSRLRPPDRIAWFASQFRAARAIGDRQAEREALGNLVKACASSGDAYKALMFSQRYLAIDRAIRGRRGGSSAPGNLGNACAVLGDARKAIEYHEQYLAVARAFGDRRGECNALGSLGGVNYALGDARKAIEYHEQYLAIARENGDRCGEGNALRNLGLAHAALGDARKAIEFYEQALVVSREIGDRHGEGNGLWNSALAHDSLGKRAEAIARAEAALPIYEAIESPWAAKVLTKLLEWRGVA